ncbi:hypothetical protein ONE63_008483 [Megalurothrips usitatus]|uniref:Uncharacterized protein n=1 Tax=Megalurothrips usitatus TaxID=439358 RepID=A0AAV7XSV8_9NEOP|nr:hypothetical protein ONE63_008483 [Megalurothrips usitatus]
MWSVIALVAVSAVLVSGHAQPQQYPQQPYGQPGGLPPPGGVGSYPPPGGAYGGVGGYNATPYGQQPYGGANGIPGYSGGNDLFRPVYEWFKIDYAWPDENLKSAALRSSQYIPDNNALAGVKVWRDRMFLSVPRWKEGVPATLASVPAQPRGGSNAPRLEPFPGWEWQELGNCSALQNVHGFEIDSENRLWVLDSGRVHNKGRTPENRCPPKLVIFDLNSAQFTDNYYNNGYNMNGGTGGYPGPGSAFNDPSRPGYNPNQPYDPNRPYSSNPSDPNYRPGGVGGAPYDPNRPGYNQPYGSNPPYGSNSPYSSNPSDPHYRPPQYSSNPADPNYRPYSSNPSDPNYRDPNYRSGYDQTYPGQSPYGQHDQFGGGAYGNNPLYRAGPGSRIRVIKSYTFPDEAAQRSSAVLNNIVLDSNDGW